MFWTSAYRPPRDEAMFLTDAGWRAFLARFERARAVALEPLADIMRYRHHTLIDVELHPPPAAVSGRRQATG